MTVENLLTDNKEKRLTKKPRQRITKALLKEWGMKWLVTHGYDVIGWGYADEWFYTKWHDRAQDNIVTAMHRHGLVKSNTMMYQLNKDKMDELFKQGETK